MTRKTYRTAQGRTVDLGALQLKNENVRAVGNMNVNARGDLVDSHNRPIDTRKQQVARQYRRQTSNVQDDVVHSSVGEKAKPNVVPAPVKQEVPADPVAEVIAQESASQEQTTTDQPVSGLAAAIARARQVKQEPLKTTQQLVQEQQGVSKI
jgi:hypothetical protein